MPGPQPHASSAATGGNLFDTIRLQYGPVDVIRRLLRLGEQEAQRRGISLAFATFDELLAINEQNRQSWRPLVGVFDPRLNMLEPSSSYCILGRNALGEVVSAQAAYKNPEHDKRPGEGIRVTAKRPRTCGDGLSSRVPAGIAATIAILG
jgi:hypothetical protein